MDWEQYKEKLKNADNDGLLRALVEQAKMMDAKMESYDAVKLIKAELLARLDGEPVVVEKDWREVLTEDEEQAVLAQYQHGVNKMAEKQFVVFNDGRQKQTVFLKEKHSGFWEIKNVLASATGDVQSEDYFTLHKSDLRNVADWVIKNIE